MLNESLRFLILTFQKMCFGFLCNDYVLVFANLIVFIVSLVHLTISLTEIVLACCASHHEQPDAAHQTLQELHQPV